MNCRSSCKLVLWAGLDPIRVAAATTALLLTVQVTPSKAQDGGQQLAASGSSASATHALAQQPPTLAAPTTATVPAPVPVTPQSEVMRDVAKFAKFDALRPQGQTTDFPGTYDTLLGDDGGWRSWLYDNNLYAKIVSTNSLTDNVFSENGSRSSQQYIGQRLTTGSNTALRMGWKIGGSGNDITQVNLCIAQDATSWDEAGPAGFNFLRFDVYSSFFNRKLEITAGEGGNILNYVGIFAGGNPILTAGLAGTIPIETGMSASPATEPLLNVQLNGNDGYYSKSGIQRSIGPDGFVSEARNNGFGLQVARRGAEPLFIEEFGVLRPASPDGRQIWVRAGGLYNMTDYARFDGHGQSRNWSAYILGDYQVYKPSVQEPYRGIFAGASALFAPGNVNVYTRTYELRAYAIGMIPGRTTDSATLTLDYNDFSKAANDSFDALGEFTRPYQWSVSGLYAIHVTRGAYLAPSITYLRHPAFFGDYKPALNLALSLTFQL